MRKSVVTALLASAIALPIALYSAASVSAPADGGTVAIVGEHRLVVVPVQQHEVEFTSQGQASAWALPCDQ